MTISVGVVFGPLDPLVKDVLSYLVVFQNTLQTTFEFRIVPHQKDDPLIEMLSTTPAVASSQAEKELVGFLRRTRKWNDAAAREYKLELEKIDNLTVLCDTRFSDEYYYVGSDDCNCTIIALGRWQDEFAPPSIVEYYLSLIAAACVDIAGPDTETHYLTRGCICDFNADLRTARLSVISGHLCGICTDRVATSTSKQAADDVQVLLKRKWLGSPSSPSDAALTVKKLGYDLFSTAGVVPSFKQRALAILEQEGLKNSLNISFQVILALMLLMIGLKK